MPSSNTGANQPSRPTSPANMTAEETKRLENAKKVKDDLTKDLDSGRQWPGGQPDPRGNGDIAIRVRRLPDNVLWAGKVEVEIEVTVDGRRQQHESVDVQVSNGHVTPASPIDTGNAGVARIRWTVARGTQKLIATCRDAQGVLQVEVK